MAATAQYMPMTGAARDSIIALCFLWAVFALVVGLRLTGRHKGPGIGADDIFAVAALILSGITIGLNVAVFTAGVGYNFDPESEIFPTLVNNMQYILLITFTFTLIYLWALAALKISQLLFYLRVFATKLRIWVYLVGGIVVAWALVFTFVFIFLCDPVEQQWTLLRIGHCMDQILVLKCIIMTNVVTDLFIVVLPIYTVWQLQQLRRTEKIAVTACFALGLACCVIGIVRFWQIYVIDFLGNLTGTSLTTFTLCTVELMLAGLCINIPMLRPFYLRVRQRHKLSQNNSGAHLESSFKPSQPTQIPPSGQPGGYSAWIELNDKDQDTSSNDFGSERKLTTTEEGSNSVIHVSTDWQVSRT